MILVLLLPIFTYRTYFLKWAHTPETYFAFTTDLYHIGQFLRAKPMNTIAYVVVNLDGTDIRGIPAPAQTIMFVTDTFRQNERTAKKIFYVRKDQLDHIKIEDDQHTIIIPLNGLDKETLSVIQKRFPSFKPKAPDDFVLLENNL